MTKQATPKGTLTKNTQCQLSVLTMTPESTGPTSAESLRRGCVEGHDLRAPLQWGDVGDDGESDGHNGAALQSHQAAEDDEFGRADGQAAHQRADGEERQADEEHRLAAK